MRPPILYPLFAPLTSLKGVGPRLAPLLERVAGTRVRDLLTLAPERVQERPRLAGLASAEDGRAATLQVRVLSHRPARARGRPHEMLVRAEGGGDLSLVWFGGGADRLEAAHPPGAERAVSGRLEQFRGRWTMAHPDYLLPADRIGEIPLLEPVYPATEGLASRQVRRHVETALARAPDLPEWQDPADLARRGWPPWLEAVRALHHPQTPEDLSPRSPPRLRLAYDELLAHQLALARRRESGAREPGAVVAASSLAETMTAALPFTLTDAQRRVLAEIRSDLVSGLRMSRLVQGDVGSGKTVVAMLAMADVAEGGGQSVLMAPTEILARQHYETLCGPLEAVGVGAVLLTGRDRGRERDAKLARLASGAAAVAVGTHALIQDDVRFRGLRLAVVDEQHRFGVAERKRLQEKGEAAHRLALTATPIPRTLELTLYGDLSVSRLDQKPRGRRPVETRAAPAGRLPEIEARLAAALAGGAQAFWICPLVSESDALDVTAAESRAARLTERLGAGVGLIHGRLPGPEKDRVMAEFAEGRLRLLVATTVVEVGVNVPNATIMVVEHAERFGLAQLHQLRGRVGRGHRESVCLLVYDPPLGAAAKARIEILRETDDGFRIAEEDLRLRGGGDLVGLKQSGFPEYRLADPFAHADLLGAAAEEARRLLAGAARLEPGRRAALEVLQNLFDWDAAKGVARSG